MDLILRVRKIKRILLLSIVLYGAAQASVLAAKPTEFAGAYTSDLVWQGAVTMASDVLILSGGSLTIRAGTQVNVVPASGTKIDPEYLSAQTELLIRGRVDIQGTAEKPVRFVIAHGTEEEEYAWSGITLDGAAESRIAHAVIERADIAIRCVGSSPLIVGNQISASRYGIVAQWNSHPDIRENRLRGGEGGIFCWRGSNPRLLNNHITGHDEEAVFVDAESRPRLAANELSGNAVGLALYPRDLSYGQVVLRNNLEDVRWLGRQGQEAE